MNTKENIMAKNIIDLANALKKAFEEKDIDTIANLYSHDIVVWHNYDQIERNRSQALDSAKWVFSEIENFSIDECKIFPIEDGYIQQCVFRGNYIKKKESMETYAMIRLYCRNETIYRIEDYSDPAQGSVPDLK